MPLHGLQRCGLPSRAPQQQQYRRQRQAAQHGDHGMPQTEVGEEGAEPWDAPRSQPGRHGLDRSWLRCKTCQAVGRRLAFSREQQRGRAAIWG